MRWPAGGGRQELLLTSSPSPYYRTEADGPSSKYHFWAKEAARQKLYKKEIDLIRADVICFFFSSTRTLKCRPVSIVVVVIIISCWTNESAAVVVVWWSVVLGKNGGIIIVVDVVIVKEKVVIFSFLAIDALLPHPLFPGLASSSGRAHRGLVVRFYFCYLPLFSFAKLCYSCCRYCRQCRRRRRRCFT